MRTSHLIYCFLFCALNSFSQFQETFSDGDFSSNPTWAGNDDHFIVNSDFELQLNAPAAGSSMLYSAVQVPDSTLWDIYFRMEFAPSNSNQLRIYLQADNADFLVGNGYFLEIGETGSEDAINFYRQDGGSAFLIASTTLASVADDPAEARLKISRTKDGIWNLAADYSNGFNFESEFNITDATYLGGNNLFFGFYCKYTSTRTDKFFFDDLNIAPLIPDETAPELLNAEAISSMELEVTFNEPLDETSANNPLNYNIDNSIGNPLSASLDMADPTKVYLTLNNLLESGNTYNLTTDLITDLVGNESETQTVSFDYFELEGVILYDILINEIMADPNPTVALPNVEYIELYNRSQKVINLEGFGFSSGSTPQLFDDFLFQPGSYLIVCDDSDVDSLSSFGEVLALSSFPALTNSGDDLTLTDPTGAIIHHVSYSIEWYKDISKEEGGWSLELINPLNPCEGAANWRAANNLIGGSPGRENSVLDSQLDEKMPDLIRVVTNASTPFSLQLFFSESLDKVSAEQVANYHITNDITVSNATLLAPSNNAVTLQLGNALTTGIIYEITIASELTDCNGNAVGLMNSLQFGLPESIEPGDIIINEILFDPYVGGSDFVEIYNRSGKVFNLSDLFIGNIQENIDTSIVPVTASVLLFPGAYAVLTNAPTNIQANYFAQNPNGLIRNSLPGFNNNFGNVTLFKNEGGNVIIIDAFDYSADFHYALLDDEEGVSLERIHPSAASNDPNSWHSAAATVGFATPTYQNSQLINPQQEINNIFDIPVKTFSPDGDGFQDFLLINYEVDQTGYTANIRIFDAAGREVKNLISNELLATNGTFQWQGETDEGRKARIGIYIVWIELFTPDGTVKEFKETCVVAGRF